MATVKAMLHSLDRDGLHQAPLQDVEIISKDGNNSYVVRTQAGVRCHAIYNIFTGYFFADDVYAVMDDKLLVRYYCPMRPPAPGAIPTRGLQGVHSCDSRETVPGCNRPVWGWVEYDHQLTDAEVSDYELIPAV